MRSGPCPIHNPALLLRRGRERACVSDLDRHCRRRGRRCLPVPGRRRPVAPRRRGRTFPARGRPHVGVEPRAAGCQRPGSHRAPTQRNQSTVADRRCGLRRCARAGRADYGVVTFLRAVLITRATATLRRPSGPLARVAPAMRNRRSRAYSPRNHLLLGDRGGVCEEVHPGSCGYGIRGPRADGVFQQEGEHRYPGQLDSPAATSAAPSPVASASSSAPAVEPRRARRFEPGRVGSRRRRCHQRVHGSRHRRCRRPLVQPVVVAGTPGRQQGEPEDHRPRTSRRTPRTTTRPTSTQKFRRAARRSSPSAV